MRNIVLVGDSQTGKSSFLRYLKGQEFTESYMVTLGKDMATIKHKNKSLLVHDMSSVERFEIICSHYYAHTCGALIFITKGTELDTWVEKLELENEDIPTVVVHNKKDLGTRRPEDCNYPYIEISCKTGENTNKVLPLLKIKEVKTLPPETWRTYFRQMSYCTVQ